MRTTLGFVDESIESDVTKPVVVHVREDDSRVAEREGVRDRRKTPVPVVDEQRILGDEVGVAVAVEVPDRLRRERRERDRIVQDAEERRLRGPDRGEERDAEEHPHRRADSTDARSPAWIKGLSPRPERCSNTASRSRSEP